MVQPTIVITRPAAQGAAFAADVRTAVAGDVSLLLAPLMEIVPVTPDRPIGVPDHIIFTSVNGVAQAARLSLPKTALAWCVGDKTAQAASTIGFETRTGPGDAAGLAELMANERPKGEILHLRGAHVSGHIIEVLARAGLRCAARVVYEQVSCAPPKALMDALRGDDPLIVPLFSPRSARLFAALAPMSAPIILIAMSEAVAVVASTIPTMSVRTAKRPEKAAMIDAILAAIAKISPRKMP